MSPTDISLVDGRDAAGYSVHMAENAPKCPHCAKPMRLARVVPAVAGHPELRSYECRACREVTTVAVEPDQLRE